MFWKLSTLISFKMKNYGRLKRAGNHYHPKRGWARGSWWLWRFTSNMFRVRMIRKWQQLKAAERAFRMFIFSKALSKP